MDARETITEDQLRGALERSGYLLETRLRRVLEQHDYAVESSPSYKDAATSKSRELDLFAVKSHSEDEPSLECRLAIECVNNPQPVAVFVTPPNARLAENLRVGGFPAMLLCAAHRIGYEHLLDGLGLARSHHYNTIPSGFQYCSFQRKKHDKEWMASHDDAHHGVLNAAIEGIEQDLDTLYDEWARDRCFTSEHLSLCYPVIVCQGELVIVDASNPELVVEAVDHAALHQKSIRAGYPTRHTIDLVTERGLPAYLALLAKECDEVLEALKGATELRRTTCERLMRNFTPVAGCRVALDWHRRVATH